MAVNNSVEEATKICWRLRDPDRKVRKEGYQKLRDLFSQADLTEKDLQSIFNASHVHFLNGLRDQAEAVREEAVNFVLFLIVDKLPLNDYYLSYVFPVFTERVGCSEVIEQSEEVRLRIIQCLNEIIKKYSKSQGLTPFYNDFVTILCKTLKDKYPEVKIASCDTIISLEKAIKADFHLQAESFIKPALICISHQRYKVRVAVVKALGVIVMHSTHKGVNEVLGVLGERLLDQNPQVRRAVGKVAGDWLLNHRDRYSYFGKMIPLLITGLCDEVKNVQNVCCDLWAKVGLQYERENEKELKDASEFLETVPDRYPENIERAGLGCRALVWKHLAVMLGALANEIISWNAEIRLKCSQLLCTLVLHAEANITQHVQGLLEILYSAAEDPDKKITSNVLTASKFVGLFVNYETWWKQFLPVLKDNPGSRHLVVLSGLLSALSLADIDKAALTITTALASNQVVYTRNKNCQLSLYKCILALKNRVPCYPKRQINYNLFKIVTCLIALAHRENENDLKPELYKLMGLDIADDKYNLAQTLYQDILDYEPFLWKITSEEACIFTTLLRHSSPSIFLMNIEVITEILKGIMRDDGDAELKIHVYCELAACFQKEDRLEIFIIKISKRRLRKNLEMLVHEVIIPSLEWHAGASAEAVRSMAIACLCCILQPTQTADKLELFNDETKTKFLEQRLNVLLTSLMEDASHLTRVMAIKCLRHLRFRVDRYDLNTMQRFLLVHAALLKRLDDPNDAVRKSALGALVCEIISCPKEIREPNYKKHRLHMLNVLLTHFDDKNEDICDVAEEAITELMFHDCFLVEVVKERFIDMRNSKSRCIRMMNALKPYITNGMLLSLECIDNNSEIVLEKV